MHSQIPGTLWSGQENTEEERLPVSLMSEYHTKRNSKN